MFLKAGFIAVLLFAVAHAEDSMIRCCRTGGLLRGMNGSISCVPALYPDSLNVNMASLEVSLEDGKSHFGNGTEGFKCREIVFDEKSGLVMRTNVIVKQSVSKNQTFKEGARYEIQRCCNIDEFVSRHNKCTKIEDMDKYNYILTKFSNFYYIKDNKNWGQMCTNSKRKISSRINDRLFPLDNDNDMAMFPLKNYMQFTKLVSYVNNAKYCINTDNVPDRVFYLICDLDEQKNIENGLKQIEQDSNGADSGTQITELEQKIDECSVNLEEQINVTIVLRANVSELEQVIQQKDDTLVVLQQNINELQTNFTAEQSNAKILYSNLDKGYQKCQEDQQNSMKKYHSVKTSYKKCEKELRGTEENLGETQVKLENVSAESAAEKEEINRLKSELAIEKQNCNEMINKKNNAMEDLQKKLDRFEAAFAEIKTIVHRESPPECQID